MSRTTAASSTSTTATAALGYVADGVPGRREVFASAPDQVIAVRLTADPPGAITFTASFDSPQQTTPSSPDNATVALDGVSGDHRGIAGSVRFLALARALAEGGTVTSSGGTLTVADADSVTLLISIGSSYVNYTDVTGDYQGIARRHLERRRGDARTTSSAAGTSPTTSSCSAGRRSTSAARRRRPHHRRADRSSTRAPTIPQFSALLFQYGRYLLISSSRPGTQPANLQGIWNDQMSRRGTRSTRSTPTCR